MNSLILDARSVDCILGGSRTWQTITVPNRSRGVFEVVQSCSNLILGKVEVVGSIGPITRHTVEQNLEKFDLSEYEVKSLLRRVDSQGVYVLILANFKRYRTSALYEDENLDADDSRVLNDRVA